MDDMASFGSAMSLQFEADESLPLVFRQQLSQVYKQQSLTTAVYHTSNQQRMKILSDGIDFAILSFTQFTKDVGSAVVNVERKVDRVETTVVRVEEHVEEVQQQMTKNHQAITQDLTEAKEEIQSVKEMVQRLDGSPRSLLLENSKALYVRFLMFLCYRWGLDHQNTLGILPFFTFAYLPGVPKMPANLIVLFHKGFLKMLIEMNIPNLPKAFLTKLDRSIDVYGQLITSLPPTQVKQLSLQFSIRKATTKIFIMPGGHFIDMLGEEHKSWTAGRGLIADDVEPGTNTTVDDSGRLIFLEDAAATKRCGLGGILSATVGSMCNAAGFNRLKTVRPPSMPAPLESYSTAVISGMAAVNDKVFGRKVPDFKEQPFHLGQFWQPVFDDPPRPFLVLASAFNGVSVSQFRTRMGLPEEKLEVDLDDDDDDEEDEQPDEKDKNEKDQEETEYTGGKRERDQDLEEDDDVIICDEQFVAKRQPVTIKRKKPSNAEGVRKSPRRHR